MGPVQSSASALAELLPHYSGDDDRARYFRGTIRKAIDSLVAIDHLQANGAVWPVHCRWIVEAFAITSELSADPALIDHLKKDSARTYFQLADVDSTGRKELLASMAGTGLPSIESLLSKNEKRIGAKNPGLIYSVYRMLCEFSHSEFQRIVSYPDLGPEGPDVAAKRQSLFTAIAIACAQTLPVFAHCPPTCGFDEATHATVTGLCSDGWRAIGGIEV